MPFPIRSPHVTGIVLLALPLADVEKGRKP
jgi:hypothetical protein